MVGIRRKLADRKLKAPVDSYLLVIWDLSDQHLGDLAGVSVRVVVHLPLPEEGDVRSHSEHTNRK